MVGMKVLHSNHSDFRRARTEQHFMRRHPDELVYRFECIPKRFYSLLIP